MTEADSRPWRRPVPLVGDATAASERAADPGGWALSAEVGQALHEVIAARRDVRRYRPDPMPDDALERVLTAAHRAPSVGHSQPWRFIVVRDAAIRDRAAALADLRMRAGEGAGAAFAAGLVLNGLGVRRSSARVTH